LAATASSRERASGQMRQPYAPAQPGAALLNPPRQQPPIHAQPLRQLHGPATGRCSRDQLISMTAQA
jgi:hypothetical protein